jgi:hypothetical protein
MIYFGVQIARTIKKPGWKGGVLAAIVMYLLLFWDLIPFHVAHKYYCETEGGFTVFKTLDEWEKENPGVAKELTHKRLSDTIKKNNTTRYQLNQRFVWDIYTTKHFLGIAKIDNRIIDTKSGVILAQYIDFSSGYNSMYPDEFRDYKIWNNVRSCEKDGHKINRLKFFNFKKSVYLLGKLEK